MNSEICHQNRPLLTLVFVGLVLGQILQQGFVDAERAAGRHLLDCIDPWEQKKVFQLNHWHEVSLQRRLLYFFSLEKESLLLTPQSSPLQSFCLSQSCWRWSWWQVRWSAPRETYDLGYIGEALARMNFVDVKTLHRVGRAGGTTEQRTAESSSPLN